MILLSSFILNFSILLLKMILLFEKLPSFWGIGSKKIQAMLSTLLYPTFQGSVKLIGSNITIAQHNCRKIFCECFIQLHVWKDGTWMTTLTDRAQVIDCSYGHLGMGGMEWGTSCPGVGSPQTWVPLRVSAPPWSTSYSSVVSPNSLLLSVSSFSLHSHLLSPSFSAIF